MGRFKLFNCFSRPKPRNDSQILKLKAQRDDLDHYRSILESRLTDFNDLCLRYLKENDRAKALFVLKRKALVSKQLSVIEFFSFKILDLISDAETAYVEADVVKNLQIGSKLLNEINKELKRTDLESFSDSDRDNINHIAESIGIVNRSLGVDDLELVQELDLLTSDLNSINYDPVSSRVSSIVSSKVSSRSSPKDSHQFDLDLSRLKSLSQSRSSLNSTNRSDSKSASE